MLFKQRTLEKIARAEVTVAFRRWRRPTVRSGGRLRTPVGELAIDVVVATTLEQITEGQALAAGFSGREEAVRVLEAGDGELYRIEFRRLGADSRAALAHDDDLDDEAMAAIRAALERLERRSESGWTLGCLRLIHEHPGTSASVLAERIGMDKVVFKRRVRQLKELGLTQSLEVGYRLSPRGRAFVSRAADVV